MMQAATSDSSFIAAYALCVAEDSCRQSKLGSHSVGELHQDPSSFYLFTP